MTDVDSGRAGAALTKLYDAHARDLHRYLARRLAPRSRTIWWPRRSWSRGSSGPARAWLYGIATNLSRRHPPGRGEHVACDGMDAGRATVAEPPDAASAARRCGPIDALLADLCSDVPEMSDHAFADGRARLQAVVAPTSVAVEPKPDTVVVPLRRKRLLRSPPRRLIASAVVLAACVLVLQAARPDNQAPVASAAAQLNAAADRIDPVDEPIEPIPRSPRARSSGTRRCPRDRRHELKERAPLWQITCLGGASSWSPRCRPRRPGRNRPG